VVNWVDQVKVKNFNYLMEEREGGEGGEKVKYKVMGGIRDVQNKRDRQR